MTSALDILIEPESGGLHAVTFPRPEAEKQPPADQAQLVSWIRASYERLHRKIEERQALRRLLALN